MHCKLLDHQYPRTLIAAYKNIQLTRMRHEKSDDQLNSPEPPSHSESDSKSTNTGRSGHVTLQGTALAKLINWILSV